MSLLRVPALQPLQVCATAGGSAAARLLRCMQAPLLQLAVLLRLLLLLLPLQLGALPGGPAGRLALPPQALALRGLSCSALLHVAVQHTFFACQPAHVAQVLEAAETKSSAVAGASQAAVDQGHQCGPLTLACRAAST